VAAEVKIEAGDAFQPRLEIPIGPSRAIKQSPTVPYSGRVTVAVANVPVPFPAHNVEWSRVKVLASNAGSVFLGPSDVTAATGYEMATSAGPETFHLSRLDRLYLVGAGVGDGASWIAA
jgi:hypothetical protein